MQPYIEIEIEPLAEKLDSIQDMPPPINPKEVRLFLGLAGYYIKFAPKLIDISLPSLTKKDVPFEQTNICQDAFNFNTLLKGRSSNTPIQKIPYTLFTDASKYVWSCVLTQMYYYVTDSKKTIVHSITYMSSLCRGSQVN